ncbi:MAG: sugar transferase [Synergistaceae bacterium]|nr:sugar transferase [Synergistaceae bacterium]
MNKYSGIIRTLLAFTQAAIDAFLYWLSFLLVVSIWFTQNNPAGFSFEVKAFFIGTVLAVFYFNSLYDFKNWIIWDELETILKSAVLVLLVIALYLYSQKFDISRFIIVVSIIIFVPLCLLARYLFRRILFAAGILSTNIIILGAGRAGEIFAKTIISHPFTACKVIGFLDDDKNKQGKIIAGFKVLGRLEDFETIYNQYRIDEAAVAISTASRKLLTHILDIVEFQVRQVHYIPDMYMLTTFSASIKDVDGMPVISASQGLLNPFNRVIKNLIDYIGALTAIIIFSPVMIITALIIKFRRKDSIFCTQKRVGWKTKHFRIYKFRAARNTKTGKFLLRFNIDELPQLFNVLRGEMSLVGPHPLIQKDVDLIYGDYIAQKIYAVKPGLTGLWQVSRSNSKDKYIRREMNLYYIRNWSVWLDIVILIKTIYIIFSKKGAY